jgi:hypothetical protein
MATTVRSLVAFSWCARHGAWRTNKKGHRNTGTLNFASGCNLLNVTIVALGRNIHLFVASLARLVTEDLINFDFGWSAFMALGAITQLFLVSLVIKGNVTLFVFVGHNISSNSNISTNEGQNHHHDYQSFHFYLPFKLIMSKYKIFSIIIQFLRDFNPSVPTNWHHTNVFALVYKRLSSLFPISHDF